MQSAFHRRSRRGYLRWMSNWQCTTCVEPVLPCATGVPCCLLPCFHPCFLQPIISQCAYLKPTFLATIPPRLYKETVFVLCVFLTSFAVSHNESELVLLWPLRSRPVISVVLILRVSLFAVHSWLSFCFRHMVWIYVFLVLKQVNLKVSFDFGQNLVCFHLKLNSKLYNNFLFVVHQH